MWEEKWKNMENYFGFAFTSTLYIFYEISNIVSSKIVNRGVLHPEYYYYHSFKLNPCFCNHKLHYKTTNLS